MKSSLTISTLLAALICLTTPLLTNGQTHSNHSTQHPYPEPSAEQSCPVSGESLGTDTVTVEHNGKLIKLCCDDCKKTFKESPQKYVGKVQEIPPEPAAYLLAGCVVSGRKLGSMGSPYVHTSDGHEVRFCCKGCLPKFQKDPAKYLKKLDALGQNKKPGGQKADSHAHKHNH